MDCALLMRAMRRRPVFALHSACVFRRLHVNAPLRFRYPKDAALQAGARRSLGVQHAGAPSGVICAVGGVVAPSIAWSPRVRSTSNTDMETAATAHAPNGNGLGSFGRLRHVQSFHFRALQGYSERKSKNAKTLHPKLADSCLDLKNPTTEASSGLGDAGVGCRLKQSGVCFQLSGWAPVVVGAPDGALQIL